MVQFSVASVVVLNLESGVGVVITVHADAVAGNLDALLGYALPGLGQFLVDHADRFFLFFKCRPDRSLALLWRSLPHADDWSWEGTPGRQLQLLQLL